MTPETIAYMLQLLDSQYQHIDTQRRRSKAAGERQRIYYSGVSVAVNAAISEAYTQPVCVICGADGNHSVVEAPALKGV